MLVAFTGRKGSGKTTAARAILARHPEALHVAFADRLKDGVANMHGVPRHVFDDPVLKETTLVHGKVTAREAMCAYGDSMRAAFGDRVFINMVARQVEKALAEGRHVVVSDLRTQDELEWLLSLDAVTLRVVRPAEPDGTCRIIDDDDLAHAKAGPGAHATETGLDHVPMARVVYNGGSRRQLEFTVCDII